MTPADLSAEALRPMVEAVARELLPDLVRQVVADATRPATRLKLAGVVKRTGLSEATINRRVKDGTFPAPQWLGPHRVFLDSDVDRWIAEQAAKPRPQRKPRGVAAWTRDQHVARSRAQRRKGKGARS